MAIRERYQNPTTNDTVRLKLFVMNANLPQNFQSVDQIDIYYYDQFSISEDNPTGRIFIETIAGSEVVNDATGSYYLDLSISAPRYVVGHYEDVWKVVVEPNVPQVEYKRQFQIYPHLWYVFDIPVVYDFNFTFQPNRITKGSKKWIIIEIIPNVPKASDLETYYQNLAISSALSISIAKKCDPCAPQEADLRTVVDEAAVEQREKVFGYYQLDTEEMDCGLYDVWFKLEFGGNIYVSEQQQLLVW